MVLQGFLFKGFSSFFFFVLCVCFLYGLLKVFFVFQMIFYGFLSFSKVLEDFSYNIVF